MSHVPLAIETIVSAPFEENTYLSYLPGQRLCVIFDPGLEPQKITSAINNKGLEPAAILLTHGHSDHIAGNAVLKSQWPDIPLVIGAGDADKLTDPTKNLSAAFGLPMTSPPADLMLSDGESYEAAGLKFVVREIPGHSRGHIVFITLGFQPNYVFGGDVLFRGSIGRTDFPDGDFAQLQHGIHQHLFTLPDDTIVFPGHGPPTTIGEEKRTNPFVGAPAGYRE